MQHFLLFEQDSRQQNDNRQTELECQLRAELENGVGCALAVASAL